jgi:type IV secretion system protein VirB1
VDITALIHQCAPAVAPVVVEAIMRTESSFDPLALHINGGARLRSPPRTASQAAAWSQWLIDRGYSVDMGLMQINSRNLASLGLSAADAFEPCQNIKAGAAILTAEYGKSVRASGAGSRALLQAISAYNTGTFTGGFRNGYVSKVVMRMPGSRPVAVMDLTCLLTSCATRPSPNPYTVDSIVPGFDGAAP